VVDCGRACIAIGQNESAGPERLPLSGHSQASLRMGSPLLIASGTQGRSLLTDKSGVRAVSPGAVDNLRQRLVSE